MAALRTGLLGKKLGMTQIFTDQGDRTGVTVIHAGKCVVVGKRTADKDGYTAVRIGYGDKPLRLSIKPEKGLAAKLNITVPRHIKEFRLQAAQLEQFEIGKEVPLSLVFKPGTFVDVTGTTKGKGFQGVIKRHHMRASVNSHGTHEFFRHGGSIGCRLTPGRVHKGKRMSGLMGNVKCTSSDLVVVKVLEDKDLVLIKGAVPGGANGIVLVKGSVKDVRKYVVPRQIREIESKNPMKASKKGAPAAAKKK